MPATVEGEGAQDHLTVRLLWVEGVRASARRSRVPHILEIEVRGQLVGQLDVGPKVGGATKLLRLEVLAPRVDVLIGCKHLLARRVVRDDGAGNGEGRSRER